MDSKTTEKICKGLKTAGLVGIGFLMGVAYTAVTVAKGAVNTMVDYAMKQTKKDEEVTKENEEDTKNEESEEAEEA